MYSIKELVCPAHVNTNLKACLLLIQYASERPDPTFTKCKCVHGHLYKFILTTHLLRIKQQRNIHSNNHN